MVTKTDLATAAAAAAQDLASNLTAILYGVDVAIGRIYLGHPARPVLAEVELATRRAAETVDLLLHFAAANGAVYTAQSLKSRLLGENNDVPTVPAGQ